MKASLDLYRVFVSAARLHSITLAAEELYISQPAVSHSIVRLEEALGCRLFARTPRGVRLTSEGETLYPYAAAALEQLALGEKKLTEQLGLESGEICVGASDMTLQFFLLPYLERFHTLYPKIKISVTNGPTPETLRFLGEGTIDFGVVSQPVTDGGDCILTPVGEIRDIFIASRRFSALEGKPLPLAELEHLPVICLEKNTSTRRYVDAFFAGCGARLTPEFELATSDLIVQFAERSLGVGCVVEAFARRAIAEGTVFRIPTEPDIPPRQICVARSRRPASKAAAALLELILE